MPLRGQLPKHGHALVGQSQKHSMNGVCCWGSLRSVLSSRHFTQSGKVCTHHHWTGLVFCVQVCVVDVDRAADVQALREQGLDACYVGLVPESSQAMLDNIQAALAHKPLPGYEPEDAACLLLQVTTILASSHSGKIS